MTDFGVSRKREDEDWACGTCTLINPAVVNRCLACEGPSKRVKREHVQLEQPIGSTMSSDELIASMMAQDAWLQQQMEEDNYARQYERNLEKQRLRGKISDRCFVFRSRKLKEMMETGVEPVSCPDIYPSLRSTLMKKSRDDTSFEYVLCGPTDHFSSDEGDRGWGCGYRNIQIVSSHLCRSDAFRNRLFRGSSEGTPTVTKLQEWLENAWTLGYDRDGSKQFESSVYDSKKWIGACDAAALFRSMSVRAAVVDFVSNGVRRDVTKMMEWIWNCFSRGQDRPPLYLQHDGHSRTCVGVIRQRGTMNLLIFDPAHNSWGLHCDLAKGDLKRLTRGAISLKHKEYQRSSCEVKDIYCSDPSVDDQYAIRHATDSNTARVLLADHRVDPTATDSQHK
ncbi:hypothetical protein PROFUN_10247 [Planoprotostelium fungivorum]|uniref:RanBP2-type domain-containing protein n=1 Tax=Planoprotostelium fungivorum TaxID=1890364 RepID=A0A2P6NEF7_9EUKA|nr:hypothetical protein PROFUN_10247 [Planoprotostelium fungivorum]